MMSLAKPHSIVRTMQVHATQYRVENADPAYATRQARQM
jgi:hypothetical protein